VFKVYLKSHLPKGNHLLITPTLNTPMGGYRKPLVFVLVVFLETNEANIIITISSHFLNQSLFYKQRILPSLGWGDRPLKLTFKFCYVQSLKSRLICFIKLQKIEVISQAGISKADIIP
jgi:hypothetical protein